MPPRCGKAYGETTSTRMGSRPRYSRGRYMNPVAIRLAPDGRLRSGACAFLAAKHWPGASLFLYPTRRWGQRFPYLPPVPTGKGEGRGGCNCSNRPLKEEWTDHRPKGRVVIG